MNTTVITAYPKHELQLYLTLAILLSVLGILLNRSTPPVFPVDDAYISLNAAQTLLTGTDKNYWGTPALAGATSIIHVMLVAGFTLFLDPLWALQAASWLAICLYVFGLAKLSLQAGTSALNALLNTILGTTAALVPYQLTNGLETGLALAALVWTLVAFNADSAKFNWKFPLLCGQLPFIRPELIALSLLLILAHAARTGKRAAARKLALMNLAVMAVGMLPWMGIYYLNTDLPFPSTVMAKKFYFAEGCLPGAVKFEWVTRYFSSFAAATGLLLLGLLPLLFSAAGRACLVFALIFATAYFKDFPGALGHYEQRYLYIFIPLLVFGLVRGLVHRAKWVRSASAAILILALLQSLLSLPENVTVYEKSRSYTEDELAGVASWVNANLPKRSTLLIHDAGYIAYATDFHLIDLVGLKSTSNIAYHSAVTWPSCGRARHEAVNAVAMSSNPQYLIVLNDWEKIFKITEGLRFHGWHLNLIRSSGVYQVYGLQRRPP